MPFSLLPKRMTKALTDVTPEPVSYTHLDVYKRQVPPWPVSTT